MVRGRPARTRPKACGHTTRFHASGSAADGAMSPSEPSERTRAPRLPEPAPGLPPGLEQWAATADVGRLPDRLARRIAQFARGAAAMDPGARARLAASLAAEAVAFVAPMPTLPSGAPVPPETLVRAVAAVRRDREYDALMLQDQRVTALTAGLADGRGSAQYR